MILYFVFKQCQCRTCDITELSRSDSHYGPFGAHAINDMIEFKGPIFLDHPSYYTGKSFYSKTRGPLYSGMKASLHFATVNVELYSNRSENLSIDEVW